MPESEAIRTTMSADYLEWWLREASAKRLAQSLPKHIVEELAQHVLEVCRGPKDLEQLLIGLDTGKLEGREFWTAAVWLLVQRGQVETDTTLQPTHSFPAPLRATQLFMRGGCVLYGWSSIAIAGFLAWSLTTGASVAPLAALAVGLLALVAVPMTVHLTTMALVAFLRGSWYDSFQSDMFLDSKDTFAARALKERLRSLGATPEEEDDATEAFAEHFASFQRAALPGCAVLLVGVGGSVLAGLNWAVIYGGGYGIARIAEATGGDTVSAGVMWDRVVWWWIGAGWTLCVCIIAAMWVGKRLYPGASFWYGDNDNTL